MVRLGALPAVISVVSACLAQCVRGQICREVCPGGPANPLPDYDGYNGWCVAEDCGCEKCVAGNCGCACNVFGHNCDACICKLTPATPAPAAAEPTYQAQPTRNKCDDYETYARWSPKEKKAHLGSKYCAARTEVSAEFVEALWQAADRDGDGNVSCAEFNDANDVESASLNLAEPICQGAEPLVREGNSSDITASKLMRMPQFRGGV